MEEEKTTEEDFIDRYGREWDMGMDLQKKVLDFLLTFPRFICFTENTRIPPNTFYVEVSSDLADKLRKELRGHK